MANEQTFHVREAQPNDAASIADLTEQLGYPVTKEVIHQRIEAAGTDQATCIFVACSDNVIAGWLEVQLRSTLESGCRAEIMGLVVDESCRRNGVGKLLVSQAKKWSMDQSQTRLRVRTNIKREDALSFYQNLGFRLTKQQHVLDVSLKE